MQAPRTQNCLGAFLVLITRPAAQRSSLQTICEVRAKDLEETQVDAQSSLPEEEQRVHQQCRLAFIG